MSTPHKRRIETHMETGHCLKAYESERDGPSVFDVILGNVENLRDLGLLRVLHVLKADGRAIDQELDEFRRLLRHG